MENKDIRLSRISLDLETKIQLTKARIREFYNHFSGNVYISFSGGKDSTVLLHIARSIYPNIKAMFLDTGLEYPEIRNFVKNVDNVDWIRPKMLFKDVIAKYGYPVISKEQAQYIYQYKTAKSEKTKHTRIYGNKSGGGKISKKWQFLINEDIKISDICCDKLKKNPAKKYEKETGLKPIIGTMATESRQRARIWSTNGCNAFNTKRPISKPLSFWTEKDIWSYIKKYNIPYSKIYDMGYNRTGCMFCMFGVHLEKEPNKFQLMKKTHQKQYDYCINKLGCGKILDLIKVKY